MLKKIMTFQNLNLRVRGVVRGSYKLKGQGSEILD